MVSLIFVAYLMLEVGCEAQAFTLCLQGRGGAQLECGPSACSWQVGLALPRWLGEFQIYKCGWGQVGPLCVRGVLMLGRRPPGVLLCAPCPREHI